MKAFGSTALLLLLAALLGGWIWWRERGPVAVPGQQIVWQINPDQVRSLSWQSGGKTVALQKNGERWTVAPSDTMSKMPVAADAEKVQQALSQIAALQSDVVLKDEVEKRRGWGLERPQSTLTVDGQHLQFGKASFDPRRIYARIDGRVTLLPATLPLLFARPFDQWRDRRVLTMQAADVDSFQIMAPSVRASFQRRKSESADATATTWTIEKPLRARADDAAIEALLNALETAQTERFLDDSGRNLKRWGLDRPQARVEISASPTISLLIGRRVEGGYAAKNSTAPTVFRIADSLWTTINRPLRDWRDKRVLVLDINAVSKVDIIWKDYRAALLKSGDGWRLVGGPLAVDAVRARSSAIELLGAVQTLRATDFASSAAESIGAQERQPMALSLWFAPSNQRLKILRNAGKLYAATSAQNGFDNPLYRLPDNALQNFEAALQRLFK